jgi:hypothetical protein
MAGTQGRSVLAVLTSAAGSRQRYRFRRSLSRMTVASHHEDSHSRFRVTVYHIVRDERTPLEVEHYLIGIECSGHHGLAPSLKARFHDGVGCIRLVSSSFTEINVLNDIRLLVILKTPDSEVGTYKAPIRSGP